MPDCEMLSKCEFFKKYSKTHVAVCERMIAEYCQGDKQSECKRKQHIMKQKEPPPENMLPGGSIIKLDARIFCQGVEKTNRKNQMEEGSRFKPMEKE